MMSVTAKHLSKSGARGSDLDAMVREHLQIIDDRLTKADRRWGRNVVPYDLPVVLAIPGLDKKGAQLIVYSAILRSLEKRGFELRILLEDDRTTIYIAWMTDLDVDEVEAMTALIRAKRIERASIGSFVDRGSIAAPRAARLAPPAAAMRVADAGRVMQPRGGVEDAGRVTAAALSRAQ